jgi:hypothetical protein
VEAVDRFLHRHQGSDHGIAGPAAGIRGIRQLVVIDGQPAKAPDALQGIFSSRGGHPGLSGENNLPVNFEEPLMLPCSLTVPLCTVWIEHPVARFRPGARSRLSPAC